jgi:type I restriction enzyme S subunit
VDSLFNIQQGKSVSKANREGQNQKPFLRTKNVFWGRLDISELDYMHFTKVEESRLKLHYGDLLLCEGGDVGRTAIWNNQIKDCYYQNHLHRLRAIDVEKISPQFALYWFWFAFEVANIYIGRSNVTTIPNMSQSKLGGLLLPKPDIREQRRISNILNTVQTAIEQQERLIALTRELKSALMHKLFTEGLRGEPQKQTEIGLIPESWEVNKLGDYADFKNGINFSSDDKGQGVLTIDVLNMYGYGCTVNLESLYRVKKSIDESYFLEDNDILFVRSSLKREGVGWTSLFKQINEPVTFCGFIIRARLIDKTAFLPRFLVYYCRTDIARKLLISGSGQVAITNINQGILRDLSLLCPSLKEQGEIEHTIDIIDKKISLLLRKQGYLNELFCTLLHQLMTGQIRVNEVEIIDNLF